MSTALKSAILILLSTLVHLGVAALYLHSPSQVPGYAEDDGENGIEVGLGMAGSYSESRPEPVPLDADEKAAPQPRPQPAPTPIVQETTAPVPVAAESHNPVVKAEQHHRTQSPSPQRSSHSADELNIDPTPRPAAALAAAPATGRARGATSGARKGDSRHYFGEIMAWLNDHKRYPAELKKRKTEGVVTVEFAIDRNGILLASKIRTSSGQPQLDQAALQMLRDASPMPAIPDWMARDTLTLAIPVEYSLITNTTFKE